MCLRCPAEQRASARTPAFLDKRPPLVRSLRVRTTTHTGLARAHAHTQKSKSKARFEEECGIAEWRR